MSRLTSEVTVEVEGPSLRGFPGRGTGRYTCFCGTPRFNNHTGCPRCGWYPPGMTAKAMAEDIEADIYQLVWIRPGSLPVSLAPRRGTASEVTAYLKKHEITLSGPKAPIGKRRKGKRYK